MEIEIEVTHEGTRIKADGEAQGVLELVERASRINLPEAVPVAIEKAKQETRQVEDSNRAKVKLQQSGDRVRSVVAVVMAAVAIVLVVQSCGAIKSFGGSGNAEGQSISR